MPLVRPSVPDVERVTGDVRTILSSGTLTKGPYLEELERRVAAYLGVRHCVAVSSCTAGLTLLLKVAGLTGEVVVPSFTFPATVHAVAWNGLGPVFCDVDRETLTLSPPAALDACGPRASAILAVHTYGTPCAVEELATVARTRGIRLFFDAAHAFGSRSRGVPVGQFGDAEVFSLAPTKLLVGCEGGIVATNDDELAEGCRIGRDYGKAPDYDCRFVGLNARLSEIHAAVALASLEDVEERIERRNQLAARYRDLLGGLPGVRFPAVRPGDRSTYKDFTLVLDKGAFGLDAEALGLALSVEGIETRRYFTPPVHRMEAYRSLSEGAGTRSLPITEDVSARVITIPLWSAMAEEDVDRVAGAIRRIHEAVRTDGRTA
jgi:dTDP-4-amino-4,6-dideoxygalactose transaminase